jgi:hypothetical protein
MGRPSSVISRVVVEDCEVVKVTDTARCVGLGIHFATTRIRGRGQRFCLLCPQCGRKAFKLYRPPHVSAFACRACHKLSYTSVQKHDARLYHLLKIAESDLVRLINQDKNMTWKLLACRAGLIRLGAIRKY